MKSGLRAAIETQVADPTSLLGTASDAIAMLLVDTARLFADLAAANSLADVRAAAAPGAARYAQLLADIDSGDVRFPYSVKGEESVLAEIAERSTAVADVYAAAQPPEIEPPESETGA